MAQRASFRPGLCHLPTLSLYLCGDRDCLATGMPALSNPLVRACGRAKSMGHHGEF